MMTLHDHSLKKMMKTLVEDSSAFWKDNEDLMIEAYKRKISKRLKNIDDNCNVLHRQNQKKSVEYRSTLLKIRWQSQSKIEAPYKKSINAGRKRKHLRKILWKTGWRPNSDQRNGWYDDRSAYENDDYEMHV